MKIGSGEDLAHLGELDEKYWTVLSCPVDDMQLDRRTLDLMDSDKDGKIKVHEVVAASGWLCSVIKDRDSILKGDSVLQLENIDRSSAEGERLYESALRILASEPQHAQKLQHNAEYFINCLHKEGVEAQSPTAIIPIIIGDEATSLQVAQELLERDCLVPAIRYPTVAKGTARLRVALMSSHTEEELAHTAKLVAEAIRKYQA